MTSPLTCRSARSTPHRPERLRQDHDAEPHQLCHSAHVRQIWFRDTLLTGKPTFETVKAGVGRTFQNIKLFSSMTVLENVMMGGQKDVSHNMLRFIVDLRGSHREERVLREKACEVLDSIGMYHLRNETVDNLPMAARRSASLAAR